MLWLKKNTQLRGLLGHRLSHWGCCLVGLSFSQHAGALKYQIWWSVAMIVIGFLIINLLIDYVGDEQCED